MNVLNITSPNHIPNTEKNAALEKPTNERQSLRNSVMRLKCEQENDVGNAACLLLEILQEYGEHWVVFFMVYRGTLSSYFCTLDTLLCGGWLLLYLLQFWNISFSFSSY